MVKSGLMISIEKNVNVFKRRCRLILAKFIHRCCPKTLRNFDKKYPQLGNYKNDVMCIAHFITVKTTFVVIVLPIIVFFTVVESLKALFRKGK